MEYIISKSSIINRCNSDGKLHLMFTEKERPCKEASLKEMKDNDGNICSRFVIELNSIEEVDALGKKHAVDVLVTKSNDFNQYIALVLYDEEIE